MIKKFLMLTIIFSFIFSSSTFAATEVEDLDRNIIEREEFFDAKNSKNEKVKLVANYESDYKDLIKQLKEQNPEYQETVAELKSQKSNISKNDLQLKLKRLEEEMISLATELLSSRYTDDKKNIKQEIIDDALGVNLEEKKKTDSFSIQSSNDRSWNTGTYGSATKKGSITNSWYTQSFGSNWSKLYLNASYLDVSATVHNGAYMTAYHSGTVDVKFLGVERRAILTCTLNSAHANISSTATLYNATTNSIRTFQILNTFCDRSNGFTTDVWIGPSTITMGNYAVTKGHNYRIYLNTHAWAFAGGVDAGDGYGVKWSRLDVNYR